MNVVVLPHGIQEHYTLGFVNGLHDRGVTVDLVLSENMDGALCRPGIRCVDLGQNKDPSLPVVAKFLRLIAYHSRLISYVLRRRKCVVHVAGTLRFEVLTGIIEGLIFRGLCRKYVLTVHNILPHEKHTGQKKTIYNLIYRIPQCLVVHTERMRNELKTQFNIPDRKIIVMQHGINDVVQDHGWDKSRCRDVLGLPANKCILLFFGNISPYKGLGTLLEAFETLGDEYVLVIAGKTSGGAYGQEVERMIDSNKNTSQIVKKIGWIENEEVATYCRAADALLMPYKHIDQSGVLFLALRFGLPVISFNVGALKDYIGEEAGIVVDGDKPRDLADGIKRFRQTADRYSMQSILDYSKQYRWADVVSPVLQVYEKDK